MNSRLLGIGTATPAHSISQAQAARVLIDAAGLSGDAADFAVAMHRRSGIDRRASVLLGATPALDAPASNDFFVPAAPGRGPDTHRGPTTDERMRQYAFHAPRLAEEAAGRAIRQSGIDAAGITHLVTVSCTGFAAPGVDHALIEALGLSRGVQRLQIGFMGCHGGIVGLRTAGDLCASAAARGEPARVLLVCVELCSLHMQYSERPDQIVSAALFGDGAAAAVLSNVPADADGCARPRRLATGPSLSRLLPESADLMGWSVGDHGFEMMLGEPVPRVIAENVGAGVRTLLQGVDGAWTAGDERVGWVIHPGGPKVLSAVAEALGLSREAMLPSREILRRHGNMSSPTVLFILEELLSRPQVAGGPDEAGPIVMLAFGPGLTVEGLALTSRGIQTTE